MKINFIRCLPVFLVVVLVIGLCAFSASAAESLPLNIFNYNDYVTNVEVFEDLDIVTVELPLSDTEWQLYTGDGNLHGHTFGSSSFYWYAISDDTYSLYSYPNGSHNRMGLTNIPSNTYCAVSFRVETDLAHIVNDITADIYYCDDDGNITRGVNANVTEDSSIDGVYVADFTLDPQPGEACVMFRISFLGIQVYSEGMIEVELLQYRLDMRISTLYREGKLTNEMLDKIINGTVDPETPTGSGSVDDLEGVEDELLGGVTDNFGEAENVLGSASQIIGRYANAFLAVSFIFGLFIQIPFINDIIMISFALGIFATLLGVGLGAISFRDAKAVKDSRKKGG